MTIAQAPPKPQSTQPITSYKTHFTALSRLRGYVLSRPPFCLSRVSPSSNSQAKFPYFITYALHRTKPHSSVTFTVLVLLQGLKVCSILRSSVTRGCAVCALV
ncbi:hypothetical protein DFJ58DRAFT_776140 [Suillus subalutaceus]|uniref:uncharacterized protein n=1 Tax=Suillus subalutaceus TaxID=48586 RepID=UPI001B867A3C|nr:uncharacterized protein DFJ58DRAFT_776140 [Suillus subalutaceus]KAG1862044.1 hypothetical protein DFJ58DRAFT_776140 [Suillus subalutaceus]